ncbi:MAG: hypothetical protein K0S68_992, partial [Candidatus Saccharibacteria bacterium]|nr:hypothetical protein [Candidatus Saccharibacteria bacterium]
WNEINRSEKLAKFPVVDCILSVLILYPLVSRFQRAILAKHSQVSVFPIILSFIYILPWLFWGGSDLLYVLILSAATAIVVWFAQSRVNHVFAKQEKLSLRFSGKEVLVAIVGLMMWALFFTAPPS